MPLRTLKHGTVHGYMHHRCRCQRCKNAWATYVKKRRINARREAPSLTPARERPDNYKRMLNLGKKNTLDNNQK